MMVIHEFYNKPEELDGFHEMLATNVDFAYMYAQSQKKRVPEAEPIISEEPFFAYRYARDILNAPFPAGEAAIAEDPTAACNYAMHVLKKPFPAGEAAIAKSAMSSYNYAKNVLNGPFPAGEPAIDAADIPRNLYQTFLDELK